jgi:hypothetical protein
MQQLTDAPRSGMDTADVRALLEADDLEVDAGLELLADGDETDLSEYLDPAGSYIERNNYAEVHGTCRLRISTEAALEWGSVRVRVFANLTGGGISARFDLGEYVLDDPEEVVGADVVEVTGYDLLLLAKTPVGRTYRAPAGAGHLATAVALLEEAGLDGAIVEDLTADPPIPADRLWPLDEATTYLRVVNDLLAASGRRGVWVDWTGRPRLERYRPPADVAPEWAYDTTNPKTIVGTSRKQKRDLSAVPNEWIFVRDDPELGLPVAGNGIYTVTTPDADPTSAVSRGGRILRRVVPLEAADQASLVSQGDRIAAADRNVARVVDFESDPNPLHWHFDVFTLTDDELGLVGTKLLATSWRFPLDGAPMTHTAKEVAA